MSMQFEFKRDRARAQLGQKVDATPSMVVSSSSNSTIPFGTLVLHDDIDAFMCKLPAPKAPLDKPLGITLRQLHSDDYPPKSSIAVLRKGRIWINAERVSAPGDSVYLKFSESGQPAFTGDKTGAIQLKGAIFLEKSEGGLVPIEINFFGGVQ